MELKSTPIFSIILLIAIPNFAFAQTLTDDQIMAKYSNPSDLQNAINNCQVKYNDLPNDAIKNSVHSSLKCETKIANNIQSNLFIVIICVIIIGPLIIFGKSSFYKHAFNKEPKKQLKTDKFFTIQKAHRTYPKDFDKHEEITPQINHSLINQILLSIGIIKVKRK